MGQSNLIPFTDHLVIIECYKCHINFAMPPYAALSRAPKSASHTGSALVASERFRISRGT